MSDNKLDIDITAGIGALDLKVSEAWPLEGVTALFGPSGSGKTSLLRLIAGFAKADTGHITCADNVWFNKSDRKFVPPHKRAIGFVHQGGHLLPHLTVQKNLYFAETRSKNRNVNNDRTMFSLDEMIEGFDLVPLENQKPDTLSGGERQRVALAQALLGKPDLLLLDEPLSALDLSRKAELLSMLERVQASHPIPMIYVSHDIAEVSRIADRVAIMKAGRIVEMGETVDVLNRHGFQTVGNVRSGTLLAGTVAAVGDATGLMSIAIGGQALKLPIEKSLTIGQDLRVIIRASDVVISTQPPVGLSVQNALEGVITGIEVEMGAAMAHVMISLGGTEGAKLVARVTQAAISSLDLMTGQSVYALIKTAVLTR